MNLLCRKDKIAKGGKILLKINHKSHKPNFRFLPLKEVTKESNVPLTA